MAGNCGLSRGAGLLHLIEQETMLRVEGLKKVFRSGESDLVLFDNLSFQVARAGDRRRVGIGQEYLVTHPRRS